MRCLMGTRGEFQLIRAPFSPSHRLAPLDRLRGLVAVLMTIDHASMFYNQGRVSADSALLYRGSLLPFGQQFTRWLSHLCAPTFILLAGLSLELAARRRAPAELPAFNRDMAFRAVLLIALDLLVVSPIVGLLHLQVLSAIGFGLLLTLCLRRLSSGVLLTLSFGWALFGEVITRSLWDPVTSNPSWLVALLFGARVQSELSLLYPVIPWLAVMLLGVVMARELTEPDASGRFIRWLIPIGVAAICCFVAVRGLNGYGNMALLRLDASVAQWLHVSKYPPSLAFLLLELGLMALVVRFFFWLEARFSLSANEPLIVFGQTSLFFFLIHQCVLRSMLPLFDAGGLSSTYVGTAVCLITMYPICLAFRTIKGRHPRTLLRLV